MPNTVADTASVKVVQVAVAVILNSAQQVLVARRPDHVHQGGLWEFPGGKVEIGESTYNALCREIHEELQVHIQSAHPLIKIVHHYPDKSVLLDVWQVSAWQGQPHGAEGQSVIWKNIFDLDTSQFPVANKKIIAALQLPDSVCITGGFSDQHDFTGKLSRAIQRGAKCIQLRCKQIEDDAAYVSIITTAKKMCDAAGVKLLLNADLDSAKKCDVGLHLPSRNLFLYQQRPVSKQVLFSASCHNLSELQHAVSLQVDFVLLSPVKETSSHPGDAGLGWDKFAELVQAVNLPVYALGGMRVSDVMQARQCGALGIAAISSYWNDDE